ncbi:MAG: dynamin family protein [Zoogloeaceae bacterium]|nr:dynamin family protein [Zoogloeaceae bacterium]
MSLVQQFATYSQWRAQVVRKVAAFRCWLDKQELGADEIHACLDPLLTRLRDDHLNVAFVAEFSRGKSELINSIFFSDYGCRILPSSVGRTTMCPTELLYRPDKPPAIELLPIETRLETRSLGEYRDIPEAWSRAPLNIDSAQDMQVALRQVSEVRRVCLKEALTLGFGTGAAEIAWYRDKNGQVEIPRWRHAIINFPHPLLKEGLVILDTPGLNAIGTEPELTLSLLPQAHAILFLLAADTGVTQSDLAIWRAHTGARQNQQRRIIVLNKIDSLWDSLKSDSELQAEIDKQVCACAEILDISASQVFPVSAQKGLLAKIHGDRELLAKSRLRELESALSGKLIPAKQEIVRDDAVEGFSYTHVRTLAFLDSRLDSCRAQMEELSRLNGKNRNVLEFTMNKARAEKDAFDASLQRYHATRNVLARLGARLSEQLNLPGRHSTVSATRATMEKVAFSKQLSDTMTAFFDTARDSFAQGNAVVDEIRAMMDVAYRRMVTEYGARLPPVAPFTLARYNRELLRLETWCDNNLSTLASLLTQGKHVITRKFFSEVVQQVIKLFKYANRDAEIWRKAILAPLETQVRERQSHLRRRLENVQRVLDAGGSLKARIRDLEATEKHLRAQIRSMDAFQRDFTRIVFHEQPSPRRQVSRVPCPARSDLPE